MTRRGLAALAVVWAAGFLAPDLHLALLYAAPALLLLSALSAGRYPGERALERCAARRAPTRRRSAPDAAPRRRPAPVDVAADRGGLLLARALAGRAPPQPLTARQ